MPGDLKKPPPTGGTRGLIQEEPLLFELSRQGRVGTSLPAWDVERADLASELPGELLRGDIDGFPELSEPQVVRHFTRLSQWNFGVDSGFYPLGSCTMKYNPKIHEEIASLPSWRTAHPYFPEALVQGYLRVLHDLERYLCEISGMDAVTLQPAAGAHGELTGILMVRAYHESRGRPRSKVLIPDTAHGTNPASATLCGYEVIEVPSGEKGILEPDLLAPHLDDEVAALMITNPNTLGLFERNVVAIAEQVHAAGGLVYCDGANLNALVGNVRPGDTGVDVLHFNLHKTFSTPHGGGGPGAGPTAVKSFLEPFLPVPRLREDGDVLAWDADRPESIGKVRAFFGNFGVLLRAYLYIRTLGPDGLRRVSDISVLNANYVMEVLKEHYHLPYPGPCMHECVFSDRGLVPYGVHTMDVAKRLMDLGFHPPTIYFPLVVSGALMIEPTETESKEELDRFCAAMIRIAREAREAPERLTTAPKNPKVTRLDEVRAARHPRLRWSEAGAQPPGAKPGRPRPPKPKRSGSAK